jgi:membrane dipeptidase
MKSASALPIFDGHNDSLMSLYLPKPGENRSFFARNVHGHIDFPRLQEGGVGGGIFAVFVPSGQAPSKFAGIDPKSSDRGYDMPMPLSVDHTYAVEITIRGMASLFRLETESEGRLRVVRKVDELEACLEKGTLAAVLHFEGAEAIDPDLNALDVFYRTGLRSIGIAWSRSNLFGHGVPFKFPHSPDTGPGLTEAGKQLVKACNQLGIAVDLAHINAKGFWDVVDLTEAPLIVSHSGVHALCPSTRNLTDDQIDAVGRSDGIIGINFHVSFLRADGQLQPDTPLSVITSHIDYVAQRIGIDHVGFGSDFDGAAMPRELADAAAMPKLLAELRAHGYDDDALRKITHQNWLRVFRHTWKA